MKWIQMYKTSKKRPKKFDYDLVVIGSGSGGGIAAHIATKAGKKVAIIEADYIGGECPNIACVPTKALLQAAEVYRSAKDSERYGISISSVIARYPLIKAWKDTVVKNTGASEGEEFYKSLGVTIIRGYGHFLSPWTISVNNTRLNARHFLVATGTRSVVPNIPGLKEAGYLTYREAIELTRPPRSLLIVGGGAIGCEFAHLFNTFGTKVTLVEACPTIISNEDPEVGALTKQILRSRGVAVHTGTTLTSVRKQAGKISVVVAKNGHSASTEVEHILLACGKAPNTDLGLENAGVAYDRRGISANKFMQTSSKHIYAAGDVVGPYGFTHTASYQSRIAAHNMFHTKRRHAARYNAVPRCVFIEPEIACAGLTEKQLTAKGYRYQVGTSTLDLIGRSNTAGEDIGFVKVLATPNGRLLGASIVSPRAGEMVHELVLAINCGLYARDVARTIHAFPTWSEAVRLACQKIH